MSIPSVSIPYGQRFITIQLEQQSKMVYTAPGNLALQLSTEVFTNSDGTATGTAISSYRIFVSQEPVLVPASVVNTSQNINTIELYINNIFVNPEINIICL